MKIGFIGAGKMAEAIIAGAIRGDVAEGHEIFAGDVSEQRRSEMKRRYGINTYSHNSAVAAAAPVLVLAVKPQVLDEVMASLAEHVGEDHLLISIAAGKPLVAIERYAPASRVIRVMPNLPATVGAGVSAFCAGTHADSADIDTARRLLESFGRVVELSEDLFDAVTAVSGSGPAFFAHFLEQVIQGGVAEGLPRAAARLLAVQTMLGTARLLQEEDLEPAALIESVCSPNGTTVAGMGVLDDPALQEIVWGTIRAAARRSRELRGDR